MTAPATPLPAGPGGPTIKRGSADARPEQHRLYGLGVTYVQRLASRIWTDYNVHDPGCTILELLCYALTDLESRAQLPVADLLASGSLATETAQFFTARQILPPCPLTLADYRKLLIDLDGIENAWIRPHAQTYFADPVAATLLTARPELPGIREVSLRGLYDVRIEFMEGIETEPARQQVIERARTILEANRNLCEEFVDVTPVEQQEFLLCAELEITPSADVVAVTAEVLYRVQRHLTPAVHNYTLAEMLEGRKPDGSRYTAPEIFDGPRLASGFIDDAELAGAELKTEIRLSDVIRVVMEVEGIRAVRDIVISPADTDQPTGEGLRWRIPIHAGRLPRLDRQKSRLVCYKGSMPFHAPAAGVAARYAQLLENERAWLEGKHEDDLAIPRGRDQHVGDYYSVQHHFPVIYGLADDWRSLPSSTSDTIKRRSALAYQLKAYLLFFDQLMANYCAQLLGLGRLFSMNELGGPTYFTQPVDFTARESIYPTYAAGAQLVEDDATAIQRRNRFLDHLIARFAERFHDYAATMYSAFAATPASLIPPKCEFLQNYPQISCERGLGYDRSLTGASDRWNSTNVSGFERRVARLLDIRNWSRRNLSELPYQLYPEVDSTPGDEFRFRLRNAATGEIMLSSSTNYATRDQAKAELDRALQFAQLPQGYQRKETSDGRFYFNIVDENGEVLARRIAYFATAELRDAAIDETMVAIQTHLEQGPRAGEGMYVIENVLLRPRAADDPFLPICVDPNCVDCADDDPYSYRVHVVLPAAAGRFATMEFRRFAEEVIRQEMPAHIVAKVCWISQEDMRGLEQAYRDWIELPGNATAATRKADLAALIQTLYAVKSVYPQQQLRGCDDETQPPFILGQTALGSGVGAEPEP